MHSPANYNAGTAGAIGSGTVLPPPPPPPSYCYYHYDYDYNNYMTHALLYCITYCVISYN